MQSQRTLARRSLLVVFMLGMLPLSGCMTAIKQGIYEMRGARGEVLPMADAPLTDVDSFGDVEFAPATTTVSDRIIPHELLTAYDKRAPEYVENFRADYETSSQKLLVRTDMIYFQSKGIMSPALLLARVKFFAGERLVQDSIVKVESQAFRAGDEIALANATLTAIEKHCKEFFKARSEDEQKRRRDELEKRREEKAKREKSKGD